jgi:integrase
MAVGAITKQAVDKLSARSKNGRLVEDHLWDPKLSGFGVKVTPAGAKSYLVQYRMGGRGATTRRCTIGAHGAPWTPATAREEAERILALVRKGTDPQEQKKAKKREAVDLAFDKYADRFLEVYGERQWGDRTLTDNKRNLNGASSAVAYTLGKKPLPEIRRADIAAVFDEIPADKPGLARNTYAVLRRLFSWAVERGDIERSPFEGFKGPSTVSPRDRVLDDAELRLVWLASDKLSYPFGPMYHLLIATGQRRQEVAALEWKELCRDRREWALPASRSKNDRAHVVPLNNLAVAALDSIAGDTWPTKGFVFTTTGETAVSGYSRAKARVDAELAKLAQEEAGEDAEPREIDPWRIHDLRRTLATGMQRLGVRFEVTEAILNHVSGARSGVAGIYQRHDWREEKQLALTAWNRHIDLLLSPTDETNVVQFAA